MASTPSRSSAPPSKRLWERLDPEAEYRQLSRTRLEHLVEIREPVVLISQIQRSGGTLLSQLFDGHPECHAHPAEIHIGKPKKWHWPVLHLGRPGTWFDVLFEKPSYQFLRDGYTKPSKRGAKHDLFPFLFLPRLQKAIFERCAATRRIDSERDVLDCYWTSYFNAWLDNQNLYAGPKRVVTGFTARLAMELANVERFFGAYPDGTLVSIVRDPRAWFASARKHRTHYHDLEEALALWRQGTTAMLEARERFGNRVALLTYEGLVHETEATMRALAANIGITYSPVLLEPTFNGRSIRADSSDAVERYGILPERTEAYRAELDQATVRRIEQLAGDLYEQAAGAARKEA